MYQRILVPIDGSAASEQGLNEAIRIAKAVHARLRLIHVVDELSFAFTVSAYRYQAGELLDLLRKDAEKLLLTALEKVKADTERDYFLTADEAKDYGLVDQVVAKRG